MMRLSILFTIVMGVVVCFMMPTRLLAEENSARKQRIVLLGARWCAPCMAELRDLKGLVDAAGSARIVLAWIDGPVHAPADVAERVDVMPAAEARELALRELGVGFGLPAALVLDLRHTACPPWRHKLNAVDLPTLRTSCGRTPQGMPSR